MLVIANYVPYPEYGAERAVRLLATALVDAGHTVRVLTTCPTGEDRCDRVENHDVQYIAQKNWYWSGDRDSKMFLTKLAWHIRDTRNPGMAAAAGAVFAAWQPDVVHTHILAGFSVDVWQAAARREIPVVHTLHDYYLLCPQSNMFTGGHTCETQCSGCGLFSLPRIRETRHLAAVTAPSAAVLSAHTSRGVFSKRTVTEVMQYVCPSRPPTNNAPQHEPFCIGFIGRLTVDKGLEHLLTWFRSTQRDNPQLRLLIAGSGPLENQVKDAAAHDARITFLGYTRPDEFFPKLNALIVPSIWHDPSPVVIREAYSFGVPVVGSTSGGIPELVRLVDERLIFEPSRPESLSTALAIALDPTLRPQFRDKAYAAMAWFAPEHVASETERLYRQVMAGKGIAVP